MMVPASARLNSLWTGPKSPRRPRTPGTYLYLDPTFGNHIITVDAIDSLGATGTSSAVSITVGAQDSPLGTWEVTTSGADKGAQFLTFQDDYSATAFGIRLKTHGVEHVSGIWNFDTKRKVTGPFFGQTGGTTNWTGTLVGNRQELEKYQRHRADHIRGNLSLERRHGKDPAGSKWHLDRAGNHRQDARDSKLHIHSRSPVISASSISQRISIRVRCWDSCY